MIPPAGYHPPRVSLSPTNALPSLSLHLDDGEDTVDKDTLIQDNPQPSRAPLCNDTGLGVNEGEAVNVDNESVHNDLGDELACNIRKKRCAYDIAQTNEYAKYVIAGPSVLTVAKHKGQDQDEDIQDIHMALYDLLGNNGVTKGWIDKDFIVIDPDVPDQIRTMNSNRDRFQIYLIKKDEIVHKQIHGNLRLSLP